MVNQELFALVPLRLICSAKNRKTPIIRIPTPTITPELNRIAPEPIVVSLPGRVLPPASLVVLPSSPEAPASELLSVSPFVPPAEGVPLLLLVELLLVES